MAIDREHNVAESMYSARLRKYEEQRCPRKYCALEFRAIEAHPEP
jgi:hypothetical protein